MPPMQASHSLPPPENPTERRARQHAMLHRLAQLNMDAAEDAFTRIQHADADSKQAEAATLSLARATRAVSHVITLENRLETGQLGKPDATRTRNDPRRRPVREILHRAAAVETDLAARNALRRAFDDRLDEELADDPDQELNAGEILKAIDEEFDLRIDPAHLPDELLAIRPKPRGPEGYAPWTPTVVEPAGPEPPIIA